MSSQANQSPDLLTRFLVHRHRTGRTHYDLRILLGDSVRNWSMLREPLLRPGEQRLAVEREEMEADAATQRVLYEEAFGRGRTEIWDRGDLALRQESEQHIRLDFGGSRLTGRYELRRTRWYPGNRWLFRRPLPGRPA